MPAYQLREFFFPFRTLIGLTLQSLLFEEPYEVEVGPRMSRFKPPPSQVVSA